MWPEDKASVTPATMPPTHFQITMKVYGNAREHWQRSIQEFVETILTRREYTSRAIWKG